VGYGEWGIVDTWRRRKPEFWGTKKAYSPTRILMKQINDFKPGSDLSIPVHNRFDHTNFSELSIEWQYGEQAGELQGVELSPHEKGDLIIPANDWNAGQKLNIRFYQHDTLLVDEYNLLIGESEIILPEPVKAGIEAEEFEERIVLRGKGFSAEVNRSNGLLENIRTGDDLMIASGPYLNLRYPGERVQGSTLRMADLTGNWKLKDLDFGLEEGIAVIRTTGASGDLVAEFQVKIDYDGIFQLDYSVTGTPAGVNIQEAGLKFLTGDGFKTLEWDREAYFTAYPEGHLGAPTGQADLNHRPPMSYRQEPVHPWESDSRGFFYFGLDAQLPYNNLVRSLKEHIFTYTLTTEAGSVMKVVSDGTQACRYDWIEGDPTLIVNDLWNYNSLLWGNYMKDVKFEEHLDGHVIIKLLK
jgi:hypothetical protein